MSEHHIVGFGIAYNEELIHCEAVMNDTYYNILFNGNWIMSMAMNGDGEWMQESGTILPESVIDEIGCKIESHYQ